MPINALLVSQARSGSTATIALLNGAGQTFVSEPLVTAVEGDLRMRTYLEQEQVSAVEFLKNPGAIFQRYCAWLRKTTGSKTIGLDVKFSQLVLLNGAMSCLDRPRILQWAIKNEFLILHLIRSNRFEQYVSTERALKSGVWHVDRNGREVRVLNGQEVRVEPTGEAQPVVVDLEACERFMTEAERRTETVRDWCRDAPLYHEMFYENVFDSEGALKPEARTELERLFGVKITDLSTLRKIGSSAFVADKAAVRRHFSGTRFEPWVEASLA